MIVDKKMNAVQLIEKVLPIEGSKLGLQYSETQNMFVSAGSTSLTGNTYFKGLRLSDRIYILLDIGIGYAHTFLNGLTIYTNQDAEKKVVGSKTYHCVYYNELTVKNDARELVKEKLLEEAKESGLQLDEVWLTEFVTSLVEDTYKEQIETLKQLQVSKLLQN